MTLRLIAERLAQETHGYSSWYAGRSFDDPKEELIVQTLWYAHPSVSENPSRECYLEAVETIESQLQALEAAFNKDEASTTDVIEALWLQRMGIAFSGPLTYTYNDHYGVYIVFYADGHADIEDEGNEYSYTYPEEPHSSVDSYVKQVYDVLEKVTRVLEHLPWGNLQNYGGRRSVIQTLYDADSLMEYTTF